MCQSRALDAVYEALRDRPVAFEIKDEFDEPNFLVGAVVVVKVCLPLPRTSFWCVNVSRLDGTGCCRVSQYPGHQIHTSRFSIRSTRVRYIILESFKFSGDQHYPPRPVMQKVVSDANDPAVPADTQSTHVMTVCWVILHNEFKPICCIYRVWISFMQKACLGLGSPLGCELSSRIYILQNKNKCFLELIPASTTLIRHSEAVSDLVTKSLEAMILWGITIMAIIPRFRVLTPLINVVVSVFPTLRIFGLELTSYRSWNACRSMIPSIVKSREN